jgi:hypothetical protein
MNNESPSNPFLDGSDERLEEEANVAAKALAEEAAARTKKELVAQALAAPKAPPKPVLQQAAPAKPAAAPVSAIPQAPVKPVVLPHAAPAYESLVPDADTNEGETMAGLSIDSIAAAIAIAFTVLLLQDVLPFLN